MARSRNIKPGFFANELLVELPFEHRLLFIGLWTIADREGRLDDRPKQIKIKLFPADNLDVDVGLTALADLGFILRYEAGGLRFIQVQNWRKHQQPHFKEKASTIPAPGQSGAFTHTASEQSPGLEQGKPEASPERAALIPDSFQSDSLQSDSGRKASRAPVELAVDWKPQDGFDVRLLKGGLPSNYDDRHRAAFIAHYRAQSQVRLPNEWDELFVKWLLRESTYGRRNEDSETAKFVAGGAA